MKPWKRKGEALFPAFAGGFDPAALSEDEYGRACEMHGPELVGMYYTREGTAPPAPADDEVTDDG